MNFAGFASFWNLFRRLNVALVVLFVLLLGGVSFVLFRFISQSFQDDVVIIDQQRCQSVVGGMAQALKGRFFAIDKELAKLQALLVEGLAPEEGAEEKLLFFITKDEHLLSSLALCKQGQAIQIFRIQKQAALFWEKMNGLCGPFPKNVRECSHFLFQKVRRDPVGGESITFVFCDMHGRPLLRRTLGFGGLGSNYQNTLKALMDLAIRPPSLTSMPFGGMGIAFQKSLTDHNGQAQKVVLHVGLKQISDALKMAAPLGVKTSFLLGPDGKILAHQKVRSGLRAQEGRLAPENFAFLYPVWGKSLESQRDSGFEKAPFRGTPLGAFFGFLQPLYVASGGQGASSILNDLTLGVLVPDSATKAIIHKSSTQALFLGLFLVILAGIVVFLFARLLVSPIAKSAHAMQQLSVMNFAPTFRAGSFFWEVDVITKTVQSLIKTLDAFGRFVPKKLVKQLLSMGQGARLGGESRTLTLLFSDIQGFTSIAETASPEALSKQLAIYFTEVRDIIARHSGTLDKYIGDAVMAFWGAPLEDPLHAVHACKAALDAKHGIDALNDAWEKAGRAVFRTRIGLGTGRVIVGNVGAPDRFQYTALGDTVNLASRMEGLNKVYQTDILVDHETQKAAADFFVFRVVDKVAVKGRTEGILIYQLLSHKEQGAPEADTGVVQLQTLSQAAFKFYEAGAFAQAFIHYGRIAGLFPDDPVCQVMRARIQSLMQHPPENWTGVWRATTK